MTIITIPSSSESDTSLINLRPSTFESNVPEKHFFSEWCNAIHVLRTYVNIFLILMC